MEQININKALNFAKKYQTEKDSIEIIYNGTANNNIDLNKIEISLNNFISNHKHNNIIECVTILRTILENCEEKSLIISYQNDKEKELVEYNKTNLVLYEKSDATSTIKYEDKCDTKLDYSNNKLNLSNYSDIESVSKKINAIAEKIYYLKNAKAITLDKDDKLLIEIYKLFYDKNPNFSNKDINTKIQTMIFILNEFGIVLENDYKFNMYSEDKIPSSLNLRKRVNKLYPLGRINNILDDIKLSTEYKKIIKIIKETIKEGLNDKQNFDEEIIKISRNIYREKYQISYKDKRNNKQSDEITKSKKLVRYIKDKINNL